MPRRLCPELLPGPFHHNQTVQYIKITHQTKRSSIAGMAMLWVKWCTQLWAWVSSLVTKPSIAFLQECTYKQFCFLTDLPFYHLTIFHAILDLVWESPAKKWLFAPQPNTPTDFRSLNDMISIPAHLPSVWKVWLRSVQQSCRNHRWRGAPCTGPRVGTNSPTFLRHGIGLMIVTKYISCDAQTGQLYSTM